MAAERTITYSERAFLEGHVTVIGTVNGKEVSRVTQHNRIMQSAGTGLDLIIQRLVSQNTYSLNITHGAIGTGSTAPTAGDTALGAEVERAIPTLQQDYGSQKAILQFFFADASLPNGTYDEFGTFVDSTQIFNRAVFSSPYVKASGQDTTVQVSFTLSQ